MRIIIELNTVILGKQCIKLFLVRIHRHQVFAIIVIVVAEQVYFFISIIQVYPTIVFRISTLYITQVY